LTWAKGFIFCTGNPASCSDRTGRSWPERYFSLFPRPSEPRKYRRPPARPTERLRDGRKGHFSGARILRGGIGLSGAAARGMGIYPRLLPRWNGILHDSVRRCRYQRWSPGTQARPPIWQLQKCLPQFEDRNWLRLAPCNPAIFPSVRFRCHAKNLARLLR